MDRLTSYHNHTTWSDGTAPLQEMIQAAAARKIERLGISDHLVLLPAKDRPDWSLTPENIHSYASAVQAETGTGETAVFAGLEADYIPSALAELKDILAACAFTYHIGSVHFVAGFPVDRTAADWEVLDQAEIDELFRKYWSLLREAAESELFQLLGHIDLPKKFGLAPAVDIQPEIDAALDSIARKHIPVELNTAGWNKPCKEAYPSPEILTACRKRRIPVIVTDDAHGPEQLAQHREAARRLLNACGYTGSSDLFNGNAAPSRF